MNVHTGHNRRQFIRRALATGTLGLTTASGQLEIRDRNRIDSDALNKFRAQLNLPDVTAKMIIYQPFIEGELAEASCPPRA
jgi:hypothetical protein